MKLPAAATVLALALLSSPPAAVAVRTSPATPRTTPSIGAPRRRHLQTPDAPPPQAQLAKVCPTDSLACPGTFFAVLRNPAQKCEFYPCPPPAPAADNDKASGTGAPNGAAAANVGGEKGIATTGGAATEENATSTTDSQDGHDQLLLADVATLGALAKMEEDGAPKGGGGPQDAAADADVEVLADELAAFDDALTSNPNPTAAIANCTPCTNVPTQNMLQRQYDCTTAIQALAVQCSDDDGWTAGAICEYSCYKAGRGYARTDVGRGGTRCCEGGEVPQKKEVVDQVEQVEEEVVEQKPEAVATPDRVDVGGIDPAEVAREEEDGEGDEGEQPASAGETDPAGSTESAINTGTVETNTVETNEDDGDESAADPDVVVATEEEAEESMAMEEATEEEMVEAGDAPQQSPAEAGADATATATANDVDVEDEDEEGEGEAEPEMEVEIISESIAIVDAAPATTEDDDEEEEGATTADEEGESTAEGEGPAAAEEAAATENETTDQDEGTVEGGQEDAASATIESTEPAATAEEEVESATTPPPEEATTVTTEEVISEDEDTDEDEDMDQAMDEADTAEAAVDEPTFPSTTTEDESTADEMTTSIADKNFDETTDPMCGVDAGGTLCPFAEDGTAVYCCSKWGFCGQGVEWCGDGCQEGYGLCGSAETTEDEAEAQADTEPGTDMAGDMGMAGDTDEESTTLDEMTPTNTNTTEPTDEDVEDESTGTAEEITEEVILPEEPTDMEDPTGAGEGPTAEEPPMDETSDIEDTEGDMDEAATTAPEDPIAEVEDLIPGDAVTEISREDGGTTTETSMDDVEGEEASGLRGTSVAAVQTATSSAAGVKVVASIIFAGTSTVVFGMI